MFHHHAARSSSINILDHLNEEQREIVTHFKGPMLVLAGAGSGKTRAITHRIAHLVNYYGISPYEIVALTFTNKAAREMQRRLGNFPNGRIVSSVTACTFHSFGLNFLKENATLLRLPPMFQIIDDEDQSKVIKDALSALNISKDDFPPKKIKGVIEGWKNQGLPLSRYLQESFYADFMKDLYGDVIRKYESLKEDQGLLDFGDLLLKMLDALRGQPELAEKYNRNIQFLLVDEYQDTNAIQYKIVKKLSENHHNITVVGDDDQSIYSFRGAEIRNILDFKQDYPEAKIVKLTKNYRSTKTILDAANSVIEKNSRRMEKSLEPTLGDGDKIKLTAAFDEKEEVSSILREIWHLLGEGYTYNDIAVFYRTNNISRRFEDTLMREKIPYRIFGSIRFYNRREIKDFTSLIKFLINRNDSLSFTRIVPFAAPGVGKTTMEKITARVTPSADYIQAVTGYLHDEAKPKIASALKSFLELEKKLTDSFGTLEPAEFIDHAMVETNYIAYLRKDVRDDKELDEKLKNIEELKIALTESKAAGKDYAEFINEITLEDLSRDDASDFLTLMTVHSAKGLEFPIVFACALEDDILPHAFSKLENNIEEERRLFYVAITRAKELLYLSYARNRNNRMQRVSPFLADIPNHLLDAPALKAAHTSIQRQPQTRPFDRRAEDETRSVINKTVFHDYFGRGRIQNVLSAGDDPVFLVEFDTAGLKKILGSFLRSA